MPAENPHQLSPQHCRKIYESVLGVASLAGARDVEALIGCRSEALTRFANNCIHQNVAEQGRWVSVRVQLNRKTARATTNRFDEASIQRTVEKAIALANAVEPDPDLLPMAEPETLTEVSRFHSSTSDTTPELRAGAVAEAIRLVESAGQTAAGIYSTEQEVESLFNSRGVAAFHSETMAHFSITAMAGDSSGWAKASSTDRTQISPLDLARRAADKARFSRSPRELPPGGTP